jgi:recombination protein RecA
MKEEDRQRAIRLKLARQESPPGGPQRPALATGFPALDAALGSGLPRGRIVEIFGPSCGKSTLLLQTAAHAQQTGCTVGWVDADRTFDPAYATRLGVRIEDLVFAQPDSAEEALEIARRLADSGAVDLLVVDSAAALVPALELEAGLGGASLGLHSRVMASGLRRLSVAVARSGSIVVFLNQTRARTGADGIDGETSAGGAPLKLYAAVRIELFPAGRTVRFRVLKNKAAAAFVAGELAWGRDPGFAKCP